jgi:hypothetical protein
MATLRPLRAFVVTLLFPQKFQITFCILVWL